jgi:hypothetical protein
MTECVTLPLAGPHAGTEEATVPAGSDLARHAAALDRAGVRYALVLGMGLSYVFLTLPDAEPPSPGGSVTFTYCYPAGDLVAREDELLAAAGLERSTGMHWYEIGASRGVYAWGSGTTYLVSVLDYEVRITRFRSPGTSPLDMAVEAARNVVTFPLGRGPGRPGGEPEMAALMEAAKTWAERFEAGESLEGYPAWQHGHAPHMASRAGDCRCVCGASYPHLRGSDDA